jgi:hypothetical protein
MSNPQYPIGPLQISEIITEKELKDAIKVLKEFPAQLRKLTENRSDAELKRPYREGSWTIQQLVHHISDSHNHSYNRIRWALTEDKPLIKAYDQDAFAKMEDYKSMAIFWSLKHIEVLHFKMVYIYESLSKEDWQRQWIHPETKKVMTIAQTAMMYAWHSKHHLAHIENGLK